MDSNNPLPQMASSSSQREVIFNANIDMVSPSAFGGRNATTSMGLTWGYIGGRFASSLIATGTLALSASTTNYIVADRSTGAISVSTSTTNWNNSTAYIRLYLVVTDASGVISYQDHRQAYGVAGDFTGPASATDTALVRFSGTSGKIFQNSGVTVDNNDSIAGYRARRNAQSGTAYTLSAADTGQIVDLTNAAPITVALPNSLAVGFACTLVQGGTGQVTLSPAGGALLRNRNSHTRLAGQWAAASLHVRGNAGGNAAEYVFNGDTST